MDNSLLKVKDFSHIYFDKAARLIDSSSHILVWGDEDADGITATAILSRTLKLLGRKFDYFVPSRNRDGIGISEAGLKRVASVNFDLLITVDCGSVNYSEITKLKKEGKKVIITDHHIPHSRLADGVPYINPHILGVRKFHGLSGAGVAFVFSQYLLMRSQKSAMQQEMWESDPKNLALAGLGTKCDRVPSSELNEEFLTHLDEIFVLFGELKKSGITNDSLCSSVTSSKTKRRRNAAVEIFLESGRLSRTERIKHLRECAKNASDYKRKLDSLYEKLKKKAARRGGECPLLLVEKNIEYRYIGVLAGRLSEEFGMPVCIIGSKGGSLSGECRAKNAYNWVEVLKKFKVDFAGWGGHPQAAGFTLKGERLEHFVSSFDSGCN